MKLTKPENDNYAATVTTITNITELDNCDNVAGTTILGFQAIIGKDTAPGTRGIAFPAETQLSDEYASRNNLYRHAGLNKDKDKAGYLEDNRRVKAMKFRGHRSDSLFMPLESLSYIKGLNINDLKEGDTFDRIGEHEICKKYQVRRKTGTPRTEKNKKEWTRIDQAFLPEHYKTDNFFRYADSISPETEVIITQKLHGTSIRIANTIVKRRGNLLERTLQGLGVQIKTIEYDYVYGSRRVIKDANNPNQAHFYGADIYSSEGKKLDGLLPQGYVVYGELIGWTQEGAPLQKNYTYKVPHGSAELCVYRVAHVNPQGVICDLSWNQVLEFCRDKGLRAVPELWRGKYADFAKKDDRGYSIPSEFIDSRYKESGYLQAVPLSEESPCDEGVCIRVDGIAPYILKAKSPLFYAHETKMLDEEAVDMEEEQNEV